MKALDCIPALKALSDETRLRIVGLLAKGPLTVSEVTEKLGVAQYNVSKHLKILREAGLLESQKNGKERVHALSGELQEQLNENGNVIDLECCTFRLDKLPK